MLDAVSTLITNFMDFLLGWLLYLPADAVLVFVALATSSLLTFIRPLTTDQDLLGRCDRDKKRLNRLIREAKVTGDADAVKRYRASVAAVAMKTMRAEFKPLLVAIIPIALLATWCFSRLSYVPVKPGTPVTVNAYFPASAIGGIAYVVPVEGVTPETGWVQRVVEDPHKGADGKVNGLARWKLKAAQRKEPYGIEIRFGERTYRKLLVADGRTFAPPIEVEQGDIHAIETTLQPYKPFGIIPGVTWRWFPLDAWIIGYLVLTIPFVFLLRHVCRIY
jgi:uncharacterized membrane protein (DUF106 family)